MNMEIRQGLIDPERIILPLSINFHMQEMTRLFQVHILHFRYTLHLIIQGFTNNLNVEGNLNWTNVGKNRTSCLKLT